VDYSFLSIKYKKMKRGRENNMVIMIRAGTNKYMKASIRYKATL